MKKSKLLSICFLGLLLTNNIGFSETYHSVKITADKLNVRQDMSIESPVLGHLDQEATIEAVASENGWYKINYEETPAYISSDYADIIENFIQGKITGQNVNLRDTPSTKEGKIISRLSMADIQVYEKEDNWYKITTADGLTGYVFGDYISIDSNLSETALILGDGYPSDLINLANSKLGCPYVWAGEGPNNFDCSGFIKYVFQETYDINLPHSASSISLKGTRIPKDALKPGDLVFFSTNRSGKVNHVGIYLGNNEFIHASSSSHNGRQVHINSINKGFYSEVYKWAQRISVE